ncbi:MAG: hypothetical protein ACKO85_15990 [Isosphaeraceae bacterium]
MSIIDLKSEISENDSWAMYLIVARLTHLQLVLLIGWLLVFAVGPVGLHSLAECSHSESADTIEHQESNHAHLAALRSAELPETDCSICVSLSSIKFCDANYVELFCGLDSEKLSLVSQFSGKPSLVDTGCPRAPPVS